MRSEDGGETGVVCYFSRRFSGLRTEIFHLDLMREKILFDTFLKSASEDLYLFFREKPLGGAEGPHVLLI